MNKINFIGILLAVLLLIFMIQGALIGGAIFFIFLKYTVYGVFIAFGIWFYLLISNKNK